MRRGALILRKNHPRNRLLGTAVITDGSFSLDVIVPSGGTVDPRFDEAIGVLNPCLQQDRFDEAEREQAYLLLGRAYFAKDLEEQAREVIAELLRLVPDYEPDPVQDAPPFRRLVERVKREMDEGAAGQPEESLVVRRDEPEEEREQVPVVSPPEKENRWLRYALIGGGVVATGALAFLLVPGDDDGPGALPAPPGRPE